MGKTNRTAISRDTPAPNAHRIIHMGKDGLQHRPADDGFDYGSLASSLRTQILRETDVIHGLIVSTQDHIIQIGLRLKMVHDSLGKAQFQRWLKAEFEWSQSTASKQMRIAAVFSDLDCLDRFQPTALYLLSCQKTPEAARTEAFDLARAGETITKSRARIIIEKHTGSPAFDATDPDNGISGPLRRFEAQMRLLSSSQICRIFGEMELVVARIQEERSRPETP